MTKASYSMLVAQMMKIVLMKIEMRQAVIRLWLIGKWKGFVDVDAVVVVVSDSYLFVHLWLQNYQNLLFDSGHPPQNHNVLEYPFYTLDMCDAQAAMDRCSSCEIRVWCAYGKKVN